MSILFIFAPCAVVGCAIEYLGQRIIRHRSYRRRWYVRSSNKFMQTRRRRWRNDNRR